MHHHQATHPGVQVVEGVLLHLLPADLLHQEAELPVPLDQLLLLGVRGVLTLGARAVQSPPCCVNRPRRGAFGALDTLLQGIAPVSNPPSRNNRYRYKYLYFGSEQRLH